MLKYFKLFLALSVSFIFSVSVASCSHDTEEAVAPKVVKRMKSVDKTSFVYNNEGKITQILWNGSLDDNIIYTESTIKIDDDIYYLKDGLVTKYVESDGWYQEFTYEGDHIKTWKKYYDDGTLDEDISFEWKNDVIVRQTDIELNFSGNMELHCDYQYSYTDYPDYGGAIAVFQSNSMFYDDLPEALIIQGYFGKWPRFLVSGAVDVSGYFSNPESYTYILDSDGYPLSMKGTDSATFSWENVNK